MNNVMLIAKRLSVIIEFRRGIRAPLFGLIGIQSGPREEGPQWLPCFLEAEVGMRIVEMTDFKKTVKPPPLFV